MFSKYYSAEGIILARKNYSEADRILSVYTKPQGRISLIAKGVRRTGSRKRGHLEIFSYIKFSASRGKGIDLITEVETIDSFKDIRKDLKKVALAYYFMEVVGKATHEHEKNEELFELVLEYLNRLKISRSLKSLRLNFVLELLTVTGFWPRGKPLPDPDNFLEQITERQINSFRVGKKILD